MVVREYYTQRSDGVLLFKTFSSDGYLIKKVGTNEIYSEAIDVETAPFTYEETDQKIETEEEKQAEGELNGEDVLSEGEFFDLLKEDLL